VEAIIANFVNSMDLETPCERVKIEAAPLAAPSPVDRIIAFLTVEPTNVTGMADALDESMAAAMTPAEKARPRRWRRVRSRSLAPDNCELMVPTPAQPPRGFFVRESLEVAENDGRSISLG
jgi:hypothetical protein